ncbi:hypothetical protein Adt_05346 [Abeliophyllum distichum]|uniref:Uncharacterized protein n=1 Tax=Abeliophyllum distichum TaxID=126358 RepID=A0ABD1V5X5_9LAMI
MTGFYFSSVPKFKIRCGGVVNDTSPTPPVLCLASALEITICNVLEVMASNPFPIPLVPKMTSGVFSTSFPARPVSSSKTSRQSVKKNAAIDDGEETALPGQGTEDRKKFQKVRRDRGNPSSEAEDHLPKDQGAPQAFTLPPASRNEYINIGSHQDELDPTVLEKLSISIATAVTSVYKYWTFSFEKAIANAELTELLKLAELHTSWSHVLNCKLYKVLAMKIEELRSMAGGGEDVDALRSENKDLHNRLAFF